PGVPTRTAVTTLLGGDTAGLAHFFRVVTTEHAMPSVLNPASRLVENREVVLDTPATRTVAWNVRPFVPGAATSDNSAAADGLTVKPCAGCRQHDTLYPFMFQTTGDGARSHVIGVVNDQSLLAGMTLALFMFGLDHC